MRLRTLLLGLAFAAPFTPALAHDFKAGALTIGHPYAIVTSPNAKTGVGYLTITNEGDTPDRLMAVEADFPKVEVHNTEIAEGVARMVPVEAVEIAPGQSVTFAPRGLHVMFMGLEAPFKIGDKIPATLVFENAGATEVTFSIQTRGEVTDLNDHSKMDHSKMGQPKPHHPEKGQPPMDPTKMDGVPPPKPVN